MTDTQLELEKLKQPRVFSLVQISSLADKLRPFANTRFDMAVIPSDPEAVVFMSHIAAMLEKAGWTWVAYGHPGGPFMTVYTMDGKPNIGQQGWSAVSIQVFADHATEFSAAADALLAALKAEGVVATRDEANAAIPNHDALHIVVGKKPL